MKNPNVIYNDTFYEKHRVIACESAKTYAEYLASIYRPSSVADVGCGRGYWLRAFREIGAITLVGFDGPWNKKEYMVADYIEFEAAELNKPFEYKSKFDLAISLEVAEHLEALSAPIFIKSLTNLSDVVLFSSAFTGQDGVNHVNEQPHTYWANHFVSVGYVPFDIFRPNFWGDERVDYCYRQNTFLYVREDSSAYKALTAMNIFPIKHLPFMDCCHPFIYWIHGRERGFIGCLKMTFEAFIPAIKRRFFKK